MNNTDKELETTLETGSTEEQEVTNTEEQTPASASEETKGIDYEAELKRLTEERDNYKTGMLNAKAKLKDKGEEVDLDGIDDVISSKVEEKINSFTTGLAEDTKEETLSAMSSDPKERDLIKYHYENSLVKTGFSKSAIQADMRKAKLLANESKLLRENEELRTSLKANNSISNSGAGANEDRNVQDTRPKYSDKELAVLRTAGLDPKTLKPKK